MAIDLKTGYESVTTDNANYWDQLDKQIESLKFRETGLNSRVSALSARITAATATKNSLEAFLNSCKIKWWHFKAKHRIKVCEREIAAASKELKPLLKKLSKVQWEIREKEAKKAKSIKKHNDGNKKFIGTKLRVRDGLIDFSKGSAKKFLDSNLVNSPPPPKMTEQGYKVLLDVVARYPVSISTIPAVYLQALSNTKVDIKVKGTTKRNANGFDVLSRTAAAGMRLADVQKNTYQSANKARFEAWDNNTRDMIGLAHQNFTVGKQTTGLNKNLEEGLDLS